MDPALAKLIAAEAARVVSPAAQAMSAAIAARHGDNLLATLFYGSCLRPADAKDPTAVGPGGTDERVMDFYAIVEDLGAANAGGWAAPLRALGNRLLPPNVFFLEVAHGTGRIRAKYALMTLDQLERLVGPETLQNYFWGRFCQPTVIVCARDDGVRRRLVRALAQAVQSMLQASAPLIDGPFDARALWTRAFAESYRAELRAEAPEPRARQIHDADAAHYARLAPLALATLPVAAAGEGTWHYVGKDAAAAIARWRRRRLVGKSLNALRIVKSAFTFEGGLDYLLWKIERHSGVRPEVRPFERRHPVLTAPAIAWRAWRAGAFK
jgi:hypothetical protein